jgi:hypothetical protein
MTEGGLRDFSSYKLKDSELYVFLIRQRTHLLCMLKLELTKEYCTMYKYSKTFLFSLAETQLFHVFYLFLALFFVVSVPRPNSWT